MREMVPEVENFHLFKHEWKVKKEEDRGMFTVWAKWLLPQLLTF